MIFLTCFLLIIKTNSFMFYIFLKLLIGYYKAAKNIPYKPITKKWKDMITRKQQQNNFQRGNYKFLDLLHIREETNLTVHKACKS